MIKSYIRKDQVLCGSGKRVGLMGYSVSIIIIFLLGCAVQRPVSKVPAPEKYPSPEPSVYREPFLEEDPFQGFPKKFRLRAIQFEKNEELPKALFCWKVVRSFAPKDMEALERIKALEAQIRTEAEKHFLIGLDYFHKNLISTARKEFLIALTYNPEHIQALDYLKHNLSDPDSIIYETQGGDTLRKISQEIYKDPEKDFLIAYFNDFDSQDKLKPGVSLKLPIITSIWMGKPTYSSEQVINKSSSLPKIRKPEVHLQEQAEVHYANGIRHYLAEELDKAIEEWEETLRLNPDHPKAKKDLQKARRMLETLRKIK